MVRARAALMLDGRPWALIGLGTNKPHAGVGGAALLSQALAAMERENLPILAVSSAWRSAAWPQPSDQPDYVNAAALIDPGALAPAALFARLAAVEAAFGRERRERWAARTLDLDILDHYTGDVADGVVIPHPHMHERAFVLAPLAEIAPDWRHPTLAQTAAALLAALPGQGTSRLGPLPGSIAEPPEAG